MDELNANTMSNKYTQAVAETVKAMYELQLAFQFSYVLFSVHAFITV